MMAAFSPIFVVDTEKGSGYNFVAPFSHFIN